MYYLMETRFTFIWYGGSLKEDHVQTLTLVEVSCSAIWEGYEGDPIKS